MNASSLENPMGRLISLDAMRGFTIAGMILVNYPASWEHIYPPLEHAEWDGLTPTDLVFPFFLFIVGVSITLSFTKLLEKKTLKSALYKKIIIRAIKIFAVGIILSLIPNLEFGNIRFAGVLQRISIVFLACSFIFLNTSPKFQARLGIFILIVYWLSLTLIPTPGIGEVSLAKGVNLAAWVDSMLLPGRMWQGTWDPEGILSTFPAIVTGITGLLAGHLLLSKRTSYEKAVLLLVSGFIAIIAGYLWGLTFPVNKNLWSSSYVLVTSGLASLVLGTMYYVVDIRNHTGGTKPGIIFGANAIAIYVLSDIISIVFYTMKFGSASLSQHFMAGLTAVGFAPALASMLYAIIFVIINFFIAYFLYKRKIFIRL